MTIVDDATRATWVYLMKTKSDVQSLVTSFYNMVVTPFNVKIKQIRTDNALEFNMSNFFSSNGILHNRILLWKESINTFFLFLGLYNFSLVSLFTFGGNVF